MIIGIEGVPGKGKTCEALRNIIENLENIPPCNRIPDRCHQELKPIYLNGSKQITLNHNLKQLTVKPAQ